MIEWRTRFLRWNVSEIRWIMYKNIHRLLGAQVWCRYWATGRGAVTVQCGEGYGCVEENCTGWGISNATEDLKGSEENINDSGPFFSENGNTGPS